MLFGDNYGPDYKHFVDFKDVWPNLNLNGPIKYLVVRSPWLKEQKQKVIKFLNNFPTHTDSSKELIGSRGDYRQMAELTLKILSVDPPREFIFKNKAVNGLVIFLIYIHHFLSCIFGVDTPIYNSEHYKNII